MATENFSAAKLRRQMMGKPRSNSDSEFSAEDVYEFVRWLTKQDQFTKELFDGSPFAVVLALRNIKQGLDPLNGVGRRGGGGYGMLYGVPFA